MDSRGKTLDKDFLPILRSFFFPSKQGSSRKNTRTFVNKFIAIITRDAYILYIYYRVFFHCFLARRDEHVFVIRTMHHLYHLYGVRKFEFAIVMIIQLSCFRKWNDRSRI